MGFVCKLIIALYLLVSLIQGIQIMQPEVMIGGFFEDFVVVLSVCGHNQYQSLPINHQLDQQKYLTNNTKQYQINMESAIDIEEETVFYFNNFNLFSPSEVTVLCKYKLFMEKFIMRLGQDWRIQSHLLGKDVVEQRNNQNSQIDLTNFNIFNQFLSDFLKGKIGNQFQHTNYPYKQLQETFNQNLNERFPEQGIRSCLTFKSLILGFFIAGNQIWNKFFRQGKRQEKLINSIQAFGKVTKVSKRPSNISLDSKSSMISNQFSSIRRGMQRIQFISFSQMDNQSEKNQNQNQNKSIWKQITEDDITEKQLKLIKNTIKKIIHQPSKSQVLSNFVCYVDELRFKNGIKIRVFSLSNQFYLFAFIVWLIFSIKTFFQLNAEDYIRYVKELMLDNWKQEFYRPVQKFQVTIQRQRNKLLNDFSVNLHDDEAVLIKLAQRLRAEIKRQWDQKISLMKECFQKEI